jgi:hypothetical protein
MWPKGVILEGLRWRKEMKVHSLDKFLVETLRNFLETQVDLYYTEMDRDHPQIGDGCAIQQVQASYEVASLAMATVARFAAGIDNKAEQIEAFQEPCRLFEDAICKTGDEWLIAQGIEPPK